MGSHSDFEHPSNEELKALKDAVKKNKSDFFEALSQRAKRMTEAGINRVTAGSPEEKPLFEKQAGSVFIRRFPQDPIALRISIGEGFIESRGPTAYCVFRGGQGDCIELLERALAAMKECFPGQEPESSGDPE